MPLELKAGTPVTLSQTIKGTMNDEAGAPKIGKDFGRGTMVRIHKHRKGVLARTSVGYTGPEEPSGDTYSFTLKLEDYKFLVPEGGEKFYEETQIIPHNDVTRVVRGTTPEREPLEKGDKVYLIHDFTFNRGHGGGKTLLKKHTCIFIWSQSPRTLKGISTKPKNLAESHYLFQLSEQKVVPKVWYSNSYHEASVFEVATI